MRFSLEWYILSEKGAKYSIFQKESGGVIMIGLKGVSKSVVELQTPESAYFERAVFYLKPNLTGIPARAVNSEAEHWIRLIAPQNRQRKGKALLRLLLHTVCCSGIGALITVIVLK